MAVPLIVSPRLDTSPSCFRARIPRRYGRTIWVREEEQRTLSRNSHCFHLGLPCSPCLTAYNHRTSPCDGDNQCLKQITPEQVIAKAREMIARD